jgi:hypothetical protein
MLKYDESIYLFFLLSTTKPVSEWILILKSIQRRYAADALLFTTYIIYTSFLDMRDFIDCVTLLWFKLYLF